MSNKSYTRFGKYTSYSKPLSSLKTGQRTKSNRHSTVTFERCNLLTDDLSDNSRYTQDYSKQLPTVSGSSDVGA